MSEIGFGGWAIGGSRSRWAYGPTDDAASLRAIAEALDLGCNLFDTADSYGDGHSEELLGQALRGRRADVVLATKVGFDFYSPESGLRFDPGYLRFALHQSLRRLRTDCVDLYQLHNPPPEILFEPAVVDELESLREAGKVRWLGVSAARAEDAVAAVEAGWTDAVQVPYNLLAPEAGGLFALARSRGVGILAREALANGMLTGKYGAASRFAPGDIRSLWGEETISAIARQVDGLRPYCREGESLAQLALRFVLESPAVSAVLVGAKTREQVRENLAFGAAPPFAKGERSMDPTQKPAETPMIAEAAAPGLPPLSASAVASLIPFPAPVQDAIKAAVLSAKPGRATDIWYEDKTTGDVHVMGHAMQWHLNGTASLVWKLLDGREVKGIVDELRKKFSKQDAAEMALTTVEFLLQAHSSGLVELYPPEPEKPSRPAKS